MDSNYSVKITNDAFTDLDNIIDYISNELASPITARKFWDEFSEKVKILSENPLIGTFVNYRKYL